MVISSNQFCQTGFSREQPVLYTYIFLNVPRLWLVPLFLEILCLCSEIINKTPLILLVLKQKFSRDTTS